MPLKLNPATACLDMVMGPGSGTATVKVAVDDNTAPGTNPVLPTGAGQITINGAAVDAHLIPVETHSRAANEFNVEVQVASTNVGVPGSKAKAGIAQFDSTDFSVTEHGYVTLIGGGASVDEFTTDIPGPVFPSVGGAVGVTGTSVFSDGTVANTLKLNIQATANTILYGAGPLLTMSELGPLTNGQLIIGSTGLAPVAGSLTSTNGSVTITGGAGTIDLAVAASNDAILTLTGDSGGALSPTSGNMYILGGPGVTVTGTGSTLTVNSVVYSDQPIQVTAASDSGSFMTNAGNIILDLPAAPAQGELLEIVCTTAFVVAVDVPAGDFIRIGSLITTSGGTATSTAIGDALKLRFCFATQTWYAISVVGVWVIA